MARRPIQAYAVRVVHVPLPPQRLDAWKARLDALEAKGREILAQRQQPAEVARG